MAGDGDYALFKDLMNMFNEERTKMEAKYREVRVHSAAVRCCCCCLRGLVGV